MSSNYSAVVLGDSPIRYYRLNETSGTVAHDLGSQALNATLNGGITLNQTGMINADTTDASMLFDGSTGYISVPTTGLPTGASAFTMECWIKVPGTLVSGDVMGFGTTTTTENWWLQSLSTPTFSLRQWSGSQENGGTPAINTVFHVAGTYDGTTAKLYINGVLKASGAATSTIIAGIAKIGNFSGSFFNGNVAEVAWYSTALTVTQLLNHYNTGISSAIVLAPVVTGATISSNDINQIINILQQPSSGTELSKYVLGGNAYIAGGFISVYVTPLSRNATPVSVTIDQADIAKPANYNALSTGHLTAQGVQIFTSLVAAAAGDSCGGNLTWNF